MLANAKLFKGNTTSKRHFSIITLEMMIRDLYHLLNLYPFIMFTGISPTPS